LNSVIAPGEKLGLRFKPTEMLVKLAGAKKGFYPDA
jgi:hypothetical protein